MYLNLDQNVPRVTGHGSLLSPTVVWYRFPNTKMYVLPWMGPSRGIFFLWFPGTKFCQAPWTSSPVCFASASMLKASARRFKNHQEIFWNNPFLPWIWRETRWFCLCGHKVNRRIWNDHQDDRKPNQTKSGPVITHTDYLQLFKKEIISNCYFKWYSECVEES